MDYINNIIAFENGELNQEQIINLFTELYQTNILFKLQGFYQRIFNDLIEGGLINIKELQAEKEI